TGAEVGADLVPGVGRPVLRARLLDHLDPETRHLLAGRAVHRGLELATLHLEVAGAVIREGREIARVDRRPAARAAHADAVVALVGVSDLLRDLDEAGQVLGRLHADLVEVGTVVGDRVELEAPRDRP